MLLGTTFLLSMFISLLSNIINIRKTQNSEKYKNFPPIEEQHISQGHHLSLTLFFNKSWILYLHIYNPKTFLSGFMKVILSL